jgi:hypothetical protein
MRSASLINIRGRVPAGPAVVTDAALARKRFFLFVVPGHVTRLAQTFTHMTLRKVNSLLSETNSQ